MVLRKFLLIFATAVAVLSADFAQAIDQAVVRRTVEKFMAGYTDKLLSRFGANSRLEYSITALDSRLVLADCPAPLRVEPKEQSQFSARLNLQVSCAQGNSWSIYVPVDLALYLPVVTTTRPLSRGDIIGAGDLQLSETEVGKIGGQYLDSLDDAIGMTAKRFIPQGSAVQPQQLDPPLMVRRGEAVTVSAESGVVSVKMPGIALTDGRRGEQIRIKNKASARVVEAQVVGPGQAIVPM